MLTLVNKASTWRWHWDNVHYPGILPLRRCVHTVREALPARYSGMGDPKKTHDAHVALNLLLLFFCLFAFIHFIPYSARKFPRYGFRF